MGVVNDQNVLHPRKYLAAQSATRRVDVVCQGINRPLK